MFQENNEYCFKSVDDFFSKKWIRMHKEVGERIDFWKHMIQVPVSLQEQIREKIIKLKNAESAGQAVSKILKKELMMTASDMVENDYPWPIGENVCTKDRYTFENDFYVYLCISDINQLPLIRRYSFWIVRCVKQVVRSVN